MPQDAPRTSEFVPVKTDILRRKMKVGFAEKTIKATKYANFLLFSKKGLLACQSARIFALFFMVLDLRLVKIGCRETINFFVYSPR